MNTLFPSRHFHPYKDDSKKQKEIYSKMIAVKGIGPKIAQHVLSSMSINTFLAALRAQDSGAFKRTPRVGKQTTKKLFTELRNQLPNMPNRKKAVRIRHPQKREKIVIPIGQKKIGRGYVHVWDGNQWLLEHRVIIETMLGRSLCKGEVVHHRNGIKTDNRLENLQLLTYLNHHPAVETKHSEDILQLLIKIRNLEQEKLNNSLTR